MGRSSSKSRQHVNLSKERLDMLSNLLVDDIQEILKTGVRKYLENRTTLLAELLMNAEVNELAGPRYNRSKDKSCYRWGEQNGSIELLDQKVPVKKPRVRDKGKTEVPLQTYEACNDREFLNERTVAKLLSGVSSRRFPETVEEVVRGRGIGRQTISQRGIEEMSRLLQELHARSIDEDILAVFIDGIHLGDTVHVAAIGVDKGGRKHVLDFEPGSTESSGVCRKLLSNLLERKILKEDESYLFVVDGGKGTQKAIREVFGSRVEVQRCMIHKRRNVEDKLPKKIIPEFRHKFNAAFNKKTHKEAEAAFLKLIRELKRARRTNAANSLLEGLQQLLTLHSLGIEGTLRRSLATTNIIESVFSAARYYTRNVKRWQGDQQMERWLAAGLLEAEKNLRRIPGYTQLKKLKDKLRPKKVK